MARITKDPETRKKEFIAAARDLFTEKGFSQTSVSDITNKVGVSHGTFFYYFKSKNDIVEAVIDDITNEWKELLGLLVVNDKMNALQKMQAVLSMAVEGQKAKSNVINEFFQKEGNEVMYKEYIRKSGEIIIPLITQIVEQGVKEGIFDVEFPRETVGYVGCILGNLGEILKNAQDDDEYNRKIRALEILLSRIAGIGENDLNLRG